MKEPLLDVDLTPILLIFNLAHEPLSALQALQRKADMQDCLQQLLRLLTDSTLSAYELMQANFVNVRLVSSC